MDETLLDYLKGFTKKKETDIEKAIRLAKELAEKCDEIEKKRKL